MRIAINLALLAITAFLAYVLVQSIREPIEFQSQKSKRETAVKDQLIKIRKAQEMYRGITGGYAASFDTLEEVLREGEFIIVKVIGDPDGNDPTAVKYDTLAPVPALDSARRVGIMIDSLRYIPYTNGEVFDIQADTLTYQQTLVSVVEVGTRYKNFMGKYASNKYKRYDNSYNPDKTIKFGDMNTPKLSGNWESN